jgi:hypothetical protein
MDLQALLEKAPDADFLRETIGLAVEGLMEMEVGAITGAAWGEKSEARFVRTTAIASATGKRGPGRSRSASPSCARADTSPASSTRGGRRRRR